MGRGRAKAKQTKVARKLKYSSGNTDLSRLAEELGASTGPSTDDSIDRHDEADDDDFVTGYSDYANRQSPPRR